MAHIGTAVSIPSFPGLIISWRFVGDAPGLSSKIPCPGMPLLQGTPSVTRFGSLAGGLGEPAGIYLEILVDYNYAKLK